MDERHPGIARLFDLAAGRGRAADARHAENCAVCRTRRDEAQRVRDAGVRALAAPRPTRRAMRRAMRAFGEANALSRRSLLRLVIDSLGATPAPALRATAARATRFLRFEGEIRVDLQISDAGRGRIDLHGQILPADYALEIVIRLGERLRRVPVSPEGSFEVRGLARREMDLTVGATRISGLRP